MRYKEAYADAISKSDGNSYQFVIHLKNWITGCSAGERIADDPDIEREQLVIAGNMDHVAIAVSPSQVMSLGHVVDGKPVSGFKVVSLEVAFGQYEEDVIGVYNPFWLKRPTEYCVSHVSPWFAP